jgi:hypothetical protein
MKDPAPYPLILHSHIPKTGGVSFGRVLQSTFPGLHLTHVHNDPTYILTPETLETLLEINPLLNSITSHHLRMFPRRLRGRRTLYITFLREPTATFVSLLKYARRQYNNWGPEVRKSWPDDTPQRGLRDLAECYLANLGEHIEHSPQTRFLCSCISMRNAGLEVEHGYGIDRPDIAALILEQFLFVGIIEEMGKSLELLGAKFKALGIELRKPFFLHLNRTRSRDDLSWLNPDDPVGKRVLQCNGGDRELYRKFRERFFETYSRYRKTGVVDPAPSSGPEDQTICEWAARQISQKLDVVR